MEILRIKLAMLWLFWIVAFLIHMFLGFFEKGVIEKIIAGEFTGIQITPDTMLLFAIFMLVPLVMAFLSLTLKDKATRWANVVLGIVYTGLCVFDSIGTALICQNRGAWPLWTMKRRGGCRIFAIEAYPEHALLPVS